MVAEEIGPVYDEALEELAARLRDEVRIETRVLYRREALQLEARHSEDANRKLAKSVWRRYARDMEAGNFAPNLVDLIAIDKHGIRNGHHRIKAVCETGVPIIATFAYADDLDWLFPRMDCGQARSWAGNQLGLANAGDWAAVIRWLYRYSKTEDGGRLVGEKKPSPAEMDSLFAQNQGIADSLAHVGHPEQMQYVLAPSIMATCHYLAAKTDRDAADEFANRVRDGVGLPDGSAILALRRGLLPKPGAPRQLHRDMKFAFVVKAWLAYEDDRPLKLIKWLPSEPFPRFRTNWPDPD
jgi:hypothetical protein